LFTGEEVERGGEERVRGTGMRAGVAGGGNGGSGGPTGEVGGKPSGGTVGSLSRSLTYTNTEPAPNVTLLHTAKLPSKFQNIRKHNKIIKHIAYVSLSLHVKLEKKKNID
jgi:hypothetical protein